MWPTLYAQFLLWDLGLKHLHQPKSKTSDVLFSIL